MTQAEFLIKLRNYVKQSQHRGHWYLTVVGGLRQALRGHPQPRCVLTALSNHAGEQYRSAVTCGIRLGLGTPVIGQIIQAGDDPDTQYQDLRAEMLAICHVNERRRRRS